MSKANGEIRIAHGPEFIPDYLAPNLDPLAPPQSVDFDWSNLEHRLGEIENDDEHREAVEARAARAAAIILKWLVPDLNLRKGSDRLVGRRAIALAWCLNPDGRSLGSIAEAIGVNTVSLSKFSASVRRTFGVRNRFQAHAANFKGRSTT